MLFYVENKYFKIKYKIVQKGDKVYFQALKDHINSFSGIILQDLGDGMILVESDGCKMYIKKDRVTRDSRT